MDLLSVSPGVVFWTLVNFTIFALILGKLGWKPLLKALSDRETSIQDSLARAEAANAQAQKILRESEEKAQQSQKEMMESIREARAQAQAQVQRGLEEAEKVKQAKLVEATAEIQREKESAMQALRSEVSNLVVMATEKILKENIDAAKQKKVVDSFIDEIQKN
jgi:F-type H+-transporting ATPase subunit b